MSRGLAALLAATLLAAALPHAVGASEPASPLPPDTVLLLVAPWCAPCYGEIARIDALSAAARPRALRVALMEDGVRARAMVRRVAPTLRWEPEATTMRAARALVAERSAGLPYSIVTDGAGRVCGDQHGGLDEERVRRLVARCRR